MLAKRLLQRRKPAVLTGEPLDCDDLAAVSLHRKHQAGSRRPAIDQHRAGAAHAMLATDMRTGRLRSRRRKSASSRRGSTLASTARPSTDKTIACGSDMTTSATRALGGSKERPLDEHLAKMAPIGARIVGIVGNVGLHDRARRATDFAGLRQCADEAVLGVAEPESGAAHAA